MKVVVGNHGDVGCEFVRLETFNEDTNKNVGDSKWHVMSYCSHMPMIFFSFQKYYDNILHFMTAALQETVVRFRKGKGRHKYTVDVKHKKTGDVRTLSFGHNEYQQFRDSVPKSLGGGLYSNMDHNDVSRRKNYFSRHSSGIKQKQKALKHEIEKSGGLFTPKILSHQYLW